MSDLDENGLDAAVKAHAACTGDNLACMKVAIRAYEAHKKPLEHRGDCTQESFTCLLCNAYNEGYEDAMAHIEDALTYARRLCVLMAEKFYPDGSPDWRPLPDLMGILTQIDNMTTGLEREKTSAACDGDPNNHCPECGLNSMTIKATLAKYEADLERMVGPKPL